mgnify:CR=1 FL=1
MAAAAVGRVPGVVERLAPLDKAHLERDRQNGSIRDRPAVALLKHLYDCWPQGETFVPTSDLTAALSESHPDQWGEPSVFGRAITAQRLGRMLANGYKGNSTRPDRVGPRGYTRASLAAAWRRMGIGTLAPVTPTPLKETSASGASGETGAVPEGVELAAARHPE